MIDTSKMATDVMPGAGEMCAVCATISAAGDILMTADRIPDETAKKPLLDGAKTMLQNVIDALNGRRTDGLVQPEEMTGEDD